MLVALADRLARVYYVGIEVMSSGSALVGLWQVQIHRPVGRRQSGPLSISCISCTSCNPSAVIRFEPPASHGVTCRFWNQLHQLHQLHRMHWRSFCASTLTRFAREQKRLARNIHIHNRQGTQHTTHRVHNTQHPKAHRAPCRLQRDERCVLLT